MDAKTKAKQVIMTAENSLRDLITEALADQRYADVKEIADLADGVAQLARENSNHLFASPSQESTSDAELRDLVEKALDPDSASYAVKPAKRVRKRKASAKKGYPKFLRDEDRLVKVGWSKKNKGEYEHRVPREAIVAFARHLNNKVEESRVFDIEGLFPVSDGSDGEVPGYQVYVIVAWLRNADVIEKKGRDGYLIRDKSVLRGNLDEQWNRLQTRSA